MRSIKLSLLALSLAAGLSTTAAAQHIDFEDAGTAGGFLTSPYHGFTWTNAFAADPFVAYGSMQNGLSNVVSGTHMVLNGGGQAMSISSTNTFNLTGGNFAAAWTNGLTMNVKGYSAGNLLYDTNYLLNWSNPQNLMLNLWGVDNVVFSTFGGTVDGAFVWDSNQSFAADDFMFSSEGKRYIEEGELSVAVVPEPMTVSLMAAGLLALGGVQVRRRRTAKSA